MWYNCLNEYLIKKEFENNPICPCAFIQQLNFRFAIVAIYVNDLNLVGTPKELKKTTTYLKNVFEIKDFRKTRFCLGLQI